MWTQRISGNNLQRSPHDQRNSFERDYNRVIHSPAFRRLQRKTQILGTKEGDFHRTRLTHSLEVASIARSITRKLRRQYVHNSAITQILPSDDLISAIALLHDIGHPPFGHGGETALNYMMRDYGGFEGNGQTLRLLTKLETSYGVYGLDLTRRTLLGILKYPVRYSKLQAKLPTKLPTKINNWSPPKCYMDCEQPEVEWILAALNSDDAQQFQSIAVPPDNLQLQHGTSRYKSLDCTIMDIADDIAYGVHDMEDAIYLKLIQYQQLNTPEFTHLFNNAFIPAGATTAASIIQQLFSDSQAASKDAIGALVNSFIAATAIHNIESTAFTEPLLKYNALLPPPVAALLTYLKDIVYAHVINSHEARTIEYGGQTVIQLLFDAILSNPEQLLNLQYRDRLQRHGVRAICDYIANMTDEYAHHMHERLAGFNTRTMFERL